MSIANFKISARRYLNFTPLEIYVRSIFKVRTLKRSLYKSEGAWKTKSLTGFTPLEIYTALKRMKKNILYHLYKSEGAWKTKSLTGFTLLETIVALAIIVAAATGPVVLVTRGILSFGFSKNKLIAINLAQEGLELVRKIRENNVICDNLNGSANWNWFKDPDGSGIINNGRFEADIITTQPLIGCGSASITSPSLSTFVNTQLRLDPTTGIYSYSGFQPTIFTREIIIDKPPADGSIPANDQRDVVSIVRWTERGIARDITLQERLYDWR